MSRRPDAARLDNAGGLEGPGAAAPGTSDVDVADEAAPSIQETAESIVHRVRRHVGVHVPGPMGDELRIQAAMPFIAGLSEGIRLSSPQLAARTADETLRLVCDGTTTGPTLVAFVRLASALGDEDRASELFDCALTNNAREDVSLWTLLELRRDMRLPESAALDSLRERVRDPRTLRLLSPRKEQVDELPQSVP